MILKPFFVSIRFFFLYGNKHTILLMTKDLCSQKINIYIITNINEVGTSH